MQTEETEIEKETDQIERKSVGIVIFLLAIGTAYATINGTKFALGMFLAADLTSMLAVYLLLKSQIECLEARAHALTERQKHIRLSLAQYASAYGDEDFEQWEDNIMFLLAATHTSAGMIPEDKREEFVGTLKEICEKYGVSATYKEHIEGEEVEDEPYAKPDIRSMLPRNEYAEWKEAQKEKEGSE